MASKYVSRRYLREKWDKLKWDVENSLDVYNTLTKKDDASDDVQRVRAEIADLMDAIKKEIGA